MSVNQPETVFDSLANQEPTSQSPAAYHFHPAGHCNIKHTSGKHWSLLRTHCDVDAETMYGVVLVKYIKFD